MSNVLKSKVLLGAMIVLAAVVGAMFIATTANAYTHSVTLKMGSTGSQVMELQKALNASSCKVAASGVGSSGMESTYFGGLTKAAVMCYQSANSLTADGVVGPMTGAKLAAVVSNDDSNDDSNDSSDLQGGAGSVDEYNAVSGLSGEEVGEDEEDVQVAGLEIEADDGSDLEFTAVRIAFCDAATDGVTSTSYGCTGSVTADAASDFEDYASEVSVWFDGEEVARLDADEFTDDNNWAKTVSLDGAVLEAGETADLVVAVSGISNLDSADAGDDWGIEFKSVRFVDAQNASTTEDPGVTAKLFSVDTFASSTDLELKVALNESDDDVNEAHVIDVDDSDDTEAEVLSFTLEADGDSDIMVKDVPVNFDVTSAANVDDMITELSLWYDGEEVGDAPNVGSGVGADETYTFEDVDVEISAGDTAEFMVKVTLKSTADVDLDNGDTISAQLGSTEVDAINAEDESGEDLGTADLTGTAVGEAHAVYDSGIMFEFVSASQVETFSADDATESDQGEFKITFKAMAFDADARVDRSCVEDQVDAAGQGVEYTITNSGSNSTTCILSSSSTDTEDTANTFEVDDNGQWRTFTLTVNATASTTAFAEVALASINWGTATNDTNANYYTFNLGDYKTDALNLADL